MVAILRDLKNGNCKEAKVVHLTSRNGDECELK